MAAEIPFHIHPHFWSLQDDVHALPTDAEEEEDLEANPELADILQYLFVEQPGALPQGYQLVQSDAYERVVGDAKEGRRFRIWNGSWARTVAFACVGTVCAAGLWAVPRWTWAENAVQTKWPSVRGDTVGKVGSYAALFVALCVLLASIDHPLLAGTLVHMDAEPVDRGSRIE